MIASSSRGAPQVPESAFVAPTAVVVGDVVLGEHSSIWYGSVLRGDVGSIRVGPRTNIQDLCVLHTTKGRTGVILGDRCLIGMGAILLDGCVIGEESLVAAGSVVREGMVVPPRSFVAGVPAVRKGPIPPEIHARLRDSADGYVRLAREHAALGSR